MRLLVLLLLLPGLIFAGQVTKTFTWAAPTTRTDGSSLDPLEIGGWRLYCGDSGGQLTMVQDINDTAARSAKQPFDDTKPVVCALTAYDKDGLESAYSNLASPVMPPAAPMQFQFTVTITTTVTQ